MKEFIEKNFILKQIESEATGKLDTLRCLNQNGQREAPGDLPAEIDFYPSGNVRRMGWYQTDQLHRDNDLPANLIFKDTPDFEVTWAVWYQRGQKHRSHGLPSSIQIDEDDGRVRGLGFCHHGKPSGVAGEFAFVCIEPDGSTVSEGGDPIDIDLSPFHGELPRPPPFAPLRFFAPD